MTEKDADAREVVRQRDDGAGGSHLTDTRSNYFLRGEHTNGAFSLTEILFQPGAQGTPMHVHTREEETYYVIEGELDVHVGDERHVIGPGGSIVLPRYLKHRVTPAPDKITRALMIVSPPGLEGMLMQLDNARPGELDVETLGRLSAEFGVQILTEN